MSDETGYVIEYSINDGATWHHGRTIEAWVRKDLDAIGRQRGAVRENAREWHGDVEHVVTRVLREDDPRTVLSQPPAPARPPGYGNWSFVIDHVPGQAWEAHIEGEDGGGWEAQDVHTLLTYVASELARSAGEPDYPPGTPMVTNDYETYPVVVLTPPATVAGYRVLAWAEAARRDGEYPAGIVLCVQPGRPAVLSTEWVPEYVVRGAYTSDGGRTWIAESNGHYTRDYPAAWADFTKRARQRPAAD